KRILVIDEAWYFMTNPDSATFLYSMAKRARKYYLGVTTITQDVEDFLANEHGKAIVSNSSIQFLMKQSSVSLPVLANTFNLSQGEQQLLMAADVGEGVFFAGQNHVALRVIASAEEHRVITTNPEELMRSKQQEEFERIEEDFQNNSSAPNEQVENSSVSHIQGLISKINQGANKDSVEEVSIPHQTPPPSQPAPQPSPTTTEETDQPPRFAGSYDVSDYNPPS
ncbi:MAG: hypothetical protein LBG64_03625, partial [Pseudomonadales bacterium]|nr:hypothetical protein [Pseudomonadales bacterium]